MTAFHGLQLALALVAGGFVVERFFVLLVRAPVDMAALEEALLARAGGLARAQAVAAALQPAWVPRLVGAAAQEPPGPRRQAAIAEQRAELLREGGARLYAIAALGRIAVPLSLVNVILEIGWAFQGGTGLVALQKGLAAQLALGHALLAVAVGMSTTVVCLVAVGILQRQLRRLLSDLDRAERWLETAGEGASRGVER